MTRSRWWSAWCPDGFKDRIEVDSRPNRCRVTRVVVGDGGDSDRRGSVHVARRWPQGDMTEADGMVFLLDNDPHWGACFVTSDYASKSSPRLRIPRSRAALRWCIGGEGCINALKRRHGLRR